MKNVDAEGPVRNPGIGHSYENHLQIDGYAVCDRCGRIENAPAGYAFCPYAPRSERAERRRYALLDAAAVTYRRMSTYGRPNKARDKISEAVSDAEALLAEIERRENKHG